LQAWIPLAVSALNIENRKAAAEATSTSVGKKQMDVTRIMGCRGQNSEEAGMATIAAVFQNVCAPEIQYGDKAIISGQLVQTVGSEPIPHAEVTVESTSSKFTSVTVPTDSRGRFRAILDTSSLQAGSYPYTVSYQGDSTNSSVTTPPQTLTVFDVPSTGPCDPCTDLITAAKRVLRDPKVNKGISEWLLGKARNDSSADLALKETALTSLANAVTGRDAVAAKGQPCRGQLRLFFEFLDLLSAEQTLAQAIEAAQKRMQNTTATSGRQLDRKKLQLNLEILKTIKFQLLDDQLRIAGEGSRTYDEQGGILISQVEAGTVYVSLLEDLFGGTEVIDDFLATDPGGNAYTHYERTAPNVGPTAPRGVASPLALPALTGTAHVNRVYTEKLTATGGTPPYTYKIVGKLPDGLTTSPSGESFVISGTLSDKSRGSGTFSIEVTDSNRPTPNTATASCSITYQQAGDNDSPQTESVSVSTASAAIVAAAKKTLLSPKPAIGHSCKIGAGLETRVILFLRPPAADVRCFSLMEGDDCCGQGKQYISKVAISATQGDDFVACKPTGHSGCTGFRLNPGWYTFSAPEEVSIEGCNYQLASSSPVSAFLGAGQGCSDIYFSYKKKGNEILVISEISSALGGDPYETAKENFPGMQYLLLLEGDQSFAQQQTTTAGGAVLFRNLAAGTYLLFCQAPATYGSQPVTPVSPADGRLTLRIFAGQKSRVPVLVKFRTTTTAPAVLDGYVRDDTGQAVPQQLVQVLNQANCLAAAGLTDANGFYSIQIYSADNLTIAVGTQQMAVSKSQLQTAMRAGGTPALPSPDAAMDLALQTSEVAGF
jgi:hypothetical protein